jgi:DNA-binding MarR family transcriptional regulator
MKKHPSSLTDPRTIKNLLSYRVHKLAGALSRGAASRYKREFGVSLVEWRTIALLGDFAPLSLKQLAALAALDKSLVSRTISALADRQLVQREVSPADAREVELRLSPAGVTLHAGLMRAAAERDAAFHGALSPEERAVLDSLLRKLEAEAWRQT